MIALPEKAIEPAIASASPGQSGAACALRPASTCAAPGSAAMVGVRIACDSRDDGRSFAPQRGFAPTLAPALDRACARCAPGSPLPLALLLFAQWPLRDLVGAWSRQANDVAQWIFALYVALALRAATRARAHMAAGLARDGHRERSRWRERIDRFGEPILVLPWAIFVVVAGAAPTWRSVVGARGLSRHLQSALLRDPLRRLAARLRASLVAGAARRSRDGPRRRRGSDELGSAWRLFALASPLMVAHRAAGLRGAARQRERRRAALGVALGAFTWPILGALPARIVGLLEHDLLQALPLYALIGALLNRLPLAELLHRAGERLFARSGAAAEMSALAVGALLAPMNGSVGASLVCAVAPRRAGAGAQRRRSRRSDGDGVRREHARRRHPAVARAAAARRRDDARAHRGG